MFENILKRYRKQNKRKLTDLEEKGFKEYDNPNLTEISKPDKSSKILISKNVPFISCRLCQKEKVME